jgi:hypothetical protein
VCERLSTACGDRLSLSLLVKERSAGKKRAQEAAVSDIRSLLLHSAASGIHASLAPRFRETFLGCRRAILADAELAHIRARHP